MIRVELPGHLRTLARVSGHEVTLEVGGKETLGAVLDALEAAYPSLRGTVRDQVTHQRRAFIRFFACSEDLSHQSPDAPLPEAVATGKEPLLIVGAIAGGTISGVLAGSVLTSIEPVERRMQYHSVIADELAISVLCLQLRRRLRQAGWRGLDCENRIEYSCFTGKSTD